MDPVQTGTAHRPRSPLPLAWILVAAIVLTGGVPALAQESGAAPAEQDATQDGGEQAGTDDAASDSAATASGRLTLAADRPRIRIGQTVTFSGVRQPANPGSSVRLVYRRPDRDPRVVAEARTGPDGSYSMTFSPRRTGVYLTYSPRQSATPLRSDRIKVAVRARIKAGARRHQLRRRGIKVTGSLLPRAAGRRVVLEHQTGKGWLRVAATRTQRGGDYAVRWEPPSLGSYRLRTRFPGDELNLGAGDPLDKPVYVYRSDEASYYGPGFYGNTTACGQTLHPETVGVAHKRLPCGTIVRFHYRGTTRRIEVIDRGPYIAGRRWDLTDAARRKLGFPAGVDQIWANK